jgi:competence protein ComEA
MARRLALLTACLLCLLPLALRGLVGALPEPRTCSPEGRGVAPRHWTGCAADPGPPRELTGRERLLAGLPVDLNSATPEDLAVVPGMTPRLAVAVVADRARRGPFTSLDDLERVCGIGPGRLARARPFLALGP